MTTVPSVRDGCCWSDEFTAVLARSAVATGALANGGKELRDTWPIGRNEVADFALPRQPRPLRASVSRSRAPLAGGVCSPIGGPVTQHLPFANQPMLSGRNVTSLSDTTASRFNKGINSQQPAVNSAPTPTSI